MVINNKMLKISLITQSDKYHNEILPNYIIILILFQNMYRSHLLLTVSGNTINVCKESEL